MDKVIQEGQKNSSKHEELLKFRFLQCRSDLFDKETTKLFLKQLFLEYKYDKLLKQPKLLKDEYWIKLFFILQEKQKKTIKELELIYQGSRDGLNGNSFWNKCNGKCNLLMIFQSQSGYIFGGYSPCQWQCNLNSYVQDDTLSSFLFSQTHDQIYSLKQDLKSRAIYCNSGYGPTFGGGHDIYINAHDFKEGSSNLGYSYQWDKYENKRSTHLFGQDKPNISECEIFELKFV
ncbi:unnamed protein product [Paramecium primaurelia]|uniref:TLDc domain-containing protein n=1 Tax=Paramecium primaurelia TaxID=5886 RepID=A0A8S1QV49_PARPR|nr:unnamed protein product [Paramecium primaurelia]